MYTLIRQFVLDRKVALFAYCGGCLATLWMYIAMFPAIQNQAQSLNSLLEKYPPALLKAFGLQSVDLSILSSYLSTEYFGLVWPLVMIILLISLCGAALAWGPVSH